MGKVTFNMTMSLDGFVAGPNDGPENGLGLQLSMLSNCVSNKRDRYSSIRKAR
jgi:hypothetical protein